MKKSGKLLCLLLALIMTLTTLPLTALAKQNEEPANEATVKITAKRYSSSSLTTEGTTVTTHYITVDESDYTLKTDSIDPYIVVNGKDYECIGYLLGESFYDILTIPAYDGTEAWEKNWGSKIVMVYVPHTHVFKYGYDRLSHYTFCACGKATEKENHVDPATDEDGICICGYKFSSNADLTTLWLANMVLSPRFTKGTTEYEGILHTYKDVTSTTISTRTFDALATVVLPEDLSIEEGLNKFEITVTAEDKKTTKTYTVTVCKPSKVDDTTISFTEDTTTVTLKAASAKKVASAEITEAAGEKMVELAAENKSAQIRIEPTFNQWGNNALTLVIPGSVLAAMAEKTEADLTIVTPFFELTSPHDCLDLLAKSTEVTFTMNKNGTHSIIGGTEDLTKVSEEITLTFPD